MKQLTNLVVAGVIGLLLVPAAALAQASIAGTVRDASAAVLPGVTVEVTSPALIEKIRSASTDGTGQYRIENLRPGTYLVTFTLPGFATVKREGLELSGSLTATVNAEMSVGGVAETVTVSGETPIVDIQSARRQEVLAGDVVKAIPTTRNYNALVVLVPGVTTDRNDVVTGPIISLFSIHGGPLSEGQLQVDGINIGNAPGLGAGGTSNYVADIGNAQEVTFTTSGGLGEVENGGAVMNIVPRTGGNSTSGSFYASGANDALQGSNYTEALKAAGLRAPDPLIKVWDVNAGVGGPVMRDRLWYFATARTQGSERYVTNLFYNKNAGNPNAWTYEPDLSRQAFSDRVAKTATLRLTWQATPRNKFNAYWDEQGICGKCTGASGVNQSPDPLTSPEAIGIGDISPQRHRQVSWNSPLSNKVLVDASLGNMYFRWGNKERPGNVTRDLVRITEQCTSGCAVNGNIPNFKFRSTDWADSFAQAFNWKTTVSYVTGGASFKAGYHGYLGKDDSTSFTNNNYLAYRVNNGVPNQFTMSGLPFTVHNRTGFHALFGQAQRTFSRLTVQGAVRYDNAWSRFLDQQVGPTRFIPIPLVFPESSGVDSYNDITPRMGAAYDLFGNGKTSIKLNLGKYLTSVTTGGNYGGPNPVNRIATTVSRTWTDANGNWTPDCDFLNPATQDLRTVGGDFCGGFSNVNFGKDVRNNTYDPNLLRGWGVRPSDWGFGASIQQQLLPRVSVEAGYFRRWFHGFTVTDNLAVNASNYAPFSVTAPADPRLPDGGGYVISGLYDVDPDKFGITNNYITDSSHYGNQTQYWHGVDVNLSARLRSGLTVQGGTSTGRQVTDNCEIRAALPEINPLNPYCHVALPFQTQLRGLASYTIPRVDVQVSGTFQSKPGAQLQANYGVPNALVVPSLGRNLAGNLPNVTVNLIEPGTLYGDRVNQLDLRVGKILKFGRVRTNVGIDVYNVFNASPILIYNSAFIQNGPWLTPISVMTARFARIGAQVDF